jgi:hypothetical protein
MAHMIDTTTGRAAIAYAGQTPWHGQAIGSELPGVAGTRWAMLNAVTELVDHERGRSNNTRMESAWFGTGAALKARAVDLLAVGV